MGDTFRMGRLPRLYFLPMVLGDTNETETTKKKIRDTERETESERWGAPECGAIFGRCFPAHTLTLLRLVVVQNGGC